MLVHAFRRMVRELEFDVCEMALTTYLCAREHGVRFTALPIFLVRAFHHGAIVCDVSAGLEDPKQLEGKRVGVGRGYTVTTGVWARSILAEEYGVDLDTITWVLSGDEHVEAYELPPNVVRIEPGKTIEALLETGELAAAVNIDATNPNIRPLIPNALEAGLAAFLRSGHYPINHLIVIRDDVLEAQPDLAVSLFDAFVESKRLYLASLKSGGVDPLTSADRLHLRMLEHVGDPLPYGIEPNCRVLENLIAHATAQRILRKPAAVESLFAPTTLELTG
ncbi:MAG: ABC transporter substrate-binding protein [Gammaproteobacteria bacterium]|nr:ABC transporter substrate-binding protein [Gammaproteobacteria bacterium]